MGRRSSGSRSRTSSAFGRSSKPSSSSYKPTTTTPPKSGSSTSSSTSSNTKPNQQTTTAPTTGGGSGIFGSFMGSVCILFSTHLIRSLIFQFRLWEVWPECTLPTNYSLHLSPPKPWLPSTRKWEYALNPSNLSCNVLKATQITSDPVNGLTAFSMTVKVVCLI